MECSQPNLSSVHENLKLFFRSKKKIHMNAATFSIYFLTFFIRFFRILFKKLLYAPVCPTLTHSLTWSLSLSELYLFLFMVYSIELYCIQIMCLKFCHIFRLFYLNCRLRILKNCFFSYISHFLSLFIC